jgi:threonine dehydrogenase-like Zn-dependent dehydrogenase
VVPLVRAEKLDTAGIFTHRLPLEEAPAAYSLVAVRSPDCVKVMLTT